MTSLCLDLKAFERRLTEYIHCLQPATGRWRMCCLWLSLISSWWQLCHLLRAHSLLILCLSLISASYSGICLYSYWGLELVNRSRDTKGPCSAVCQVLFLSSVFVLKQVSFLTSLWNHPFFTISCITLIGLFFAGIHKRVVAPSIIAARCRTILAEYNMSCDDTGKLILKPRPHVQ
ncbi:hypothetical protein QTO34_010826 [Cnephaeus nilssonii]|uniref:Nuclear envelope phosphatase-regulatory subunit 1 n=1 Tax=Cnephaeus nilssonii TaxID=3371016 RepID=A0AA40LF69_CNENI|nr:hypothetical protein QTO34_010826 [Eptesicus nilssonii]